VTRDAHDIVAELTRVGLGHSDILPARPQASQISCHLPVQQSQHRSQVLTRLVDIVPAMSPAS
ncbi:hypothetical protein, partial [Nocardia otitidiscaviarum]|uniref:hypothetical protein n=1 Tax=Nocardia otitidiscaviarum TaxID=1823 RepID=UPI001E343B98